MVFYKILFAICVSIIVHSSKVGANLSCRDENGDTVEWYFLYKLPDEKGNSDGSNDGTEYMFIKPKTLEKGWQISNILITSKQSIPSVTLDPLYKTKTNDLWIMYNDQPPASNKSGKGHTKGVIGADDSGGFWLVHSVPRFPPSPNTSDYEFPKNAFKNGQSFLCISLSKDIIDEVGTQLQYNEALIYDKNIPSVLKSIYPKLTSAAQKKRLPKGNINNIVTLTSVEGSTFYSFAKSSKFNKDLYEDWVAPELKTDLFVESWLNGRGALPSNCSKEYKVNNVEKVQVCEVDRCSSFLSSKDHSKWAVSSSKNNPWLCVGDINRAKSQEDRGGGTVCLKNPSIWMAYYKSVASIKPCSKSKGIFDRMKSFFKKVLPEAVQS